MSDYKDIFSGQSVYDTQNITATGAWLSWSGHGLNEDGKGNLTEQFPLLLSQITMNYSRNVQPIYPVNGAVDNTFVKLQILGAPQGTLQCTGIVTPKYDTMLDFLEKTSQNCSEDDVVMDFKPFTTSTGKCHNRFGYRIIGLTLQTLGFSVQGGEVAIISQPLAFTFTGLQLLNIKSDYRQGNELNDRE